MLRKGEDWGAALRLPVSAAVFDNDRDLATAYRQLLSDDPNAGFDELSDRALGMDGPTVGLTGGDLHRTLGAPSHSPADLRSGEAMGFPMDVGIVELIGDAGSSAEVFVAHMEARARRARFAGLTVVAMNAAFVGRDNLGPRAHPGDGRIDLTIGQLGLWDRLRVGSRQRAGTHLPHPHLEERRRGSHDLGMLIPGYADEPPLKDPPPMDPPLMEVVCDGTNVGRMRLGRLMCIHEALTVVV